MSDLWTPPKAGRIIKPGDKEWDVATGRPRSRASPPRTSSRS